MRLGYYIKRLQKLGVQKSARSLLGRIKRRMYGSYPACISVEIMTLCNLHCKHCRVTYHGDLIPDVTREFMTFEYFTRIADRLSPLIRKARAFQFSSIEPLFHKDIFRMMDYVSAIHPDLRYPLLTNGLLLDKERIAELLRRNVPTVAISLDGCTRETVESFKTNTDFDRVVRHIKMLREMAGQRLEIHVVFIATRNNIHELVDYVGFCKQLGVDRIMVNGFTSFLPEMAHLYLYSRQGNADVAEIFRQAYHRAKSLDIEIMFPALTVQPTGCESFSCMTITEKGDVAPCILLARRTPFEFLSAVTVVEPIIWGNVFAEEPLSIWRKPEFRSFRIQLQNGQIPTGCSLCPDAYGLVCSRRSVAPQ